MIQVKDKQFRLLIPEAEIQQQVKRVAGEIARDYRDKEPLFLGVLNGAFMFTSDLMKHIDIPCELTFVKCASYSGTETSGEITRLIGVNADKIKGRHVVIIEDIVDTGYTMQAVIADLLKAEPASVKLASCTVKPESLRCDIKVDYVGIEVPNLFILGYGLDYDGFGRNYSDIYVLAE